MIPGDPTLMTLLVLELVCVLAYFLKGFSGFGPAIVLVPTVTIAIGPDTALANSALIDLVVGLALLSVFDYSREDLGLVGRMAALVAAGAFTGGLLVGSIPSSIVSYAIGGFVLAFSIWLMVAGGGTMDGGNRWYLWAGSLLGGFTGGLVGIAGPFIVAGSRPLLDKSTFRRILIPVFVVAGVFKLLGYTVSGVWSMQVLWLVLALAPAVMIGLFIGYRAHPAVSERVFDLVIGTVLVVLAVRLLLPLI